MEEAKQLLCKPKARLKQDDLNMFDWELMRKKVLNDIQQSLASDPLSFKGVNVRATLELDPVKRPWNKA